ncbi:MAG: hypothetical protein QN121_02595 [Armatimonadota bacterium]|nr:hypothetical protein [Armatimonadota bacterium]
MEEEILDRSIHFKWPAYDVAYMALAARNGWELVTADDRFFRAASDHFRFVRRVEDLAADLG